MQTDQEKPRVGLLGVGLMGSAMAHRLLEQGIAVIAWDVDSDHVHALEARGGEPAKHPKDVVSDAGIVITMLPTADVVLDVVQPLLDEWPAGTIWLQMSSVGAAEADQLTQAADAHGVTLVDAPVSGSTHPAEQGQLTILASGPDSVHAAVDPVFAALASRVLWVGAAGMGSRLKLAANHWMITMVAALAESMHLCQTMGLDQQEFIALLDGGPLGSSTHCRSSTRCAAMSTPPASRSGSPSRIWSSSARLSDGSRDDARAGRGRRAFQERQRRSCRPGPGGHL